VQLHPQTHHPPPRPASGSHRFPNTLGQVGEQYGPSITPFARARCPLSPLLRPYSSGGAARGSHAGQFSCFGPRSCFIAFILDIPNGVWPLNRAVGRACIRETVLLSLYSPVALQSRSSLPYPCSPQSPVSSLLQLQPSLPASLLAHGSGNGNPAPPRPGCSVLRPGVAQTRKQNRAVGGWATSRWCRCRVPARSAARCTKYRPPFAPASAPSSAPGRSAAGGRRSSHFPLPTSHFPPLEALHAAHGRHQGRRAGHQGVHRVLGGRGQAVRRARERIFRVLPFGFALPYRKRGSGADAVQAAAAKSPVARDPI
jgi:hypothetical protein